MLFSIITPTYNEAKNVKPFILAIRKTLKNYKNYEIIFVDDNSSDKTYKVVKDLSRKYKNIRCLRRIGRRGLSSAVIEGSLSSSADLLLVMDADLQHDEKKIPEMLELQKNYKLDMVVGSRFLKNKYASGLSKKRNFISRLANWLAAKISGVTLSDPMSGFFLVKRSIIDEHASKLTGLGFKILLDIFSSAKIKIKYKEIGFNFRKRKFGESKLSTLVVWEYILLLWETRFGKIIPARFVSFCVIGGTGVMNHLLILYVLKNFNFKFIIAQSVATFSAMTGNFFLNNILTYRDRQKKGIEAFIALIIFYITCGLGAIANVGIANSLYLGKINEVSFAWYVSGIVGALVGAIWNFLMSTLITWRQK
ncbi:MAG: Undecaprenyl-phosphate mannosyltransferase [Alphaproteobacteria bacterium MarineAlpha9_Bin4]|nr:dolichol monophosphate mannose synthase [Pelagibacterales bacterium]PPR27300.1 MAG: Undecaprenyl-phosphate mannosyltransferase [Alphaproteobacteria bacterium MarineAlpha9_Bin4]